MRTTIVSILLIGVLASVFILPFSELIKTGEGKNSLNVFTTEGKNDFCSIQPPVVEWEKTFGGPEWDTLYCVQGTDDGGCVAVGIYTYTDDLNHAWILKLDSEGNEEWSTIETAELFGMYFLMTFVQQTSDDGYIISGYVLKSIEEVDKEFDVGILWKVDATGTTEWIRWYTQEEEPIITVPWVTYEVDDGYVAAGFVTYSDNTQATMLMKIDPTGTMEWQKIYTICDGGSSGRSLCMTNDGGYLIGGTAFVHGNDFFLIKTDNNGDKEWDKIFGGSGTDYQWSRGCFQTHDGGIILNGLTTSYGAGKMDVWVVKTDASGNMVWNETYGEKRDETCYSMEVTNDGGYIFAATKNYGGFTDTKGDVWIVKTDCEGNAQWNLTIGGLKEDRGYYVSKMSDGGYIVSGRTESFGAGNCDGWLIKIGPDKEMTTPTLQVRKPKSGYLYLFDIIGIPFLFSKKAFVLGDLTFHVDASDQSGICKVEFFINDKVEGETTEQPYVYSWSEGETGKYLLKIRAYNNYGGTTQQMITIQKVI